MTLQIVLLVAPLRHDAQCVLEKGDDDQEASQGGEVRLDRLRVDIDVVFHFRRDGSHLIQGRLLSGVRGGLAALAGVRGLAV